MSAHDYGVVACFELARDAGRAASAPATDLFLAHNVAARAGVDAATKLAAAAGGRIVKPAQGAFWAGYAGIWMGTCGNAWNPQWQLAR